MEKAIASSAVAIIAQIVAIDSVTAEQGIFIVFCCSFSVVLLLLLLRRLRILRCCFCSFLPSSFPLPLNGYFFTFLLLRQPQRFSDRIKSTTTKKYGCSVVVIVALLPLLCSQLVSASASCSSNQLAAALAAAPTTQKKKLEKNTCIII